MKRLYKYQSTNSEANEAHVIIYPDEHAPLFAQQLADVQNQLEELLKTPEMQGYQPVFARYFISDAANQIATLEPSVSREAYAVSVVQQPPLCGVKVALWVYMIADVEVCRIAEGFYAVKHGVYNHYWKSSDIMLNGDSEKQTIKHLLDYSEKLSSVGLSLADNCVRTWFFVQDIDNNYSGVVKGRNEVFATHGLTTDTHYIASTGIGGRSANAATKVLMDAYAVGGLQPQQMNYLYAKSHLNRTSEYGVAFERGTYLNYGDRRHVYISGTASIDNKGNVLYVNDICKQTHRMWDNVAALLAEANASWDDVGVMIVYLRDMADYDVVKSMYEERFSGKPYIIVQAPVCRAGWLIEMECMAVVARKMSDVADF
ncbi:MAG: hypothetical protein K6G73_04305 [Marinilabiliaceae bacterium]|nr:hypothetical protein [Marinilabiliaceae bacterium]